MSRQPRHPAGRAIRRAAIANLGCKVNQSEMDDVERLLRVRGVELVGGDEPADVVVVNTCTVTSIADRKSRQAIRRARRASPEALLLVTGCTATVDPAAIATLDPRALVFDNTAKSRMAIELARLLDLPEGRPMPTHAGVEPAFEREVLERWRVEVKGVEAFRAMRGKVETGRGPTGPAAVPKGAGSPGVSPEAERERIEPGVEPEGACAYELETEGDDFAETIDRTRAFVKIQDGCSFHCTYCIIPRARGPERSISAEAVLAEVHRAVAAGHREIVLTGINAGTYADGAITLPALIRRILAETPIERIRLSSIEPQHVTDELLAVWTGSGGRCLPHFHVPLQSGDDTILRRMGRRYDTALYRDLLGRIRGAIPDVAFHADLIAGFPGEDDAAWARTMAFLRSLDLAGIHVFRYSARPGTPAARMVGQVHGRTKKARAAEALELSAEARAGFASRQLGRELWVLFERRLPDGRWIGHAENHVLIEAASPDGSSLENVIGLVRAEEIDRRSPDRVAGRPVRLSFPQEPLAWQSAK